MSKNVAAVVLAAGMSSRMAPHNKLLLTDASGAAMVARVVDAVLASKVMGVWVVVGHQARRIAAALGSRPVHLIYAPDYESGMAAGLVRGVAALPAAAAAALVCLADMPDVGSAAIDGIVEAYQPQSGRLIVVPVFGGQRGNPVLWDRRFFAEILTLTGDRGARTLLDRHARAVSEYEALSPGVLVDVDMPEQSKAGGDVPSPPDHPSIIRPRSN